MKFSLLISIFLSLFVSCKNGTNKEGDVKRENKTVNRENKAVKTFVKNNNVYVVFSDSSVKQLTFNESDYYSFLLTFEDEVLFIRNVKESGVYNDYIRKKIMKVDIETLKEVVVTEKKPYLDGNDRSDKIFHVGNPTVSSDQNYLFFIVEKAVTSNQLVKVNLKDGKWTELFSAESFELIVKDPYKNYFIISRSEIKDEGRKNYLKLIDDKGKLIKEFRNRESVFKFKKEIGLY